MSWQVCYKATGQKCPNALFKTSSAAQKFINDNLFPKNSMKMVYVSDNKFETVKDLSKLSIKEINDLIK